jgi:hypothetical protein
MAKCTRRVQTTPVTAGTLSRAIRPRCRPAFSRFVMQKQMLVIPESRAVKCCEAEFEMLCNDTYVIRVCGCRTIRANSADVLINCSTRVCLPRCDCY